MTRRSTVPLGRLAVAAAVTAAVLLMIAGPTARAGDDPAAGARQVEPAISVPSEEAKLTFAAPGLVLKALVHEGEAVKAGQPLLQQDDSEERPALESAKQDAESTAEVEYEKADVAFKQTVANRRQELWDQPGHNIALSELEQAKQDVALSQAQVKVADLHHAQKQLDYKKEQAKSDLMTLRSPIDGVVQRIVTHAGEMSDPQNKDGAIIVVGNDPLWVEMNISADRAQKLTMGQEMQVRYKAPAGEPASAWMTAKISYFPPHADAASGTEMVWMTLPNPSGERSGLAMEVRLPDNVAAVASGN